MLNCDAYILPADIPDAGEGACCIGTAVRGPRHCTCWVEVFSAEQAEIRPGLPPVPIPLRPCEPGNRDGGCAYRPGSPERRGAPGYQAGGDDLDRLAVEGTPFYCHAGIRYLIGLVHPPSGVAYSPQLGDYRPPVKDGVPYRADGQPAYVCAGWLLRRAVLTREAGRP